jgi:AraC family transcriptional regulator of arabinose operon
MDPRVCRVIEIMNAEFHRALSPEELARTVNLSDSRLRHVFKLETGTSLVHYLRQLRMARAKDLTETTFLTVKEIMAAVGFQDASHFVRDFQKVYGLSPKRTRAGAPLSDVATTR